MDSTCYYSSMAGSSIPKKKGENQRFKWLSTATKITNLVQKATTANIRCVADEIMTHDVVSCRGPFCRAVMRAQSGSPNLTALYATLVAAVNSRFPDVGLLLVKRLALQLRTAHASHTKKTMHLAARFLAQLVNQAVVYEVLALDILQLLLIEPKPDNIYLAVRFCTDCGQLLLNRAPHKLKDIFKEFRLLLRKGELSKQAQVSILRLFNSRRNGFKRSRAVMEGMVMDLLGDDEGVMHEVSLLHDIRAESSLDDYHSGPGLDECELFGRLRIGDGDADESG